MTEPDTPPPDDAETANEPRPEQPPERLHGRPRELPRGCNPLTFGVVMATLEMALLLGLWLRCR